jgi:hypothetical protein
MRVGVTGTNVDSLAPGAALARQAVNDQTRMTLRAIPMVNHITERIRKVNIPTPPCLRTTSDRAASAS